MSENKPWKWACTECNKRGELAATEAVVEHESCDGIVMWLAEGPVERAADAVMTKVVDVLLDQVQGTMDRAAVRHALREDVVLLIAEAVDGGAICDDGAV